MLPTVFAGGTFFWEIGWEGNSWQVLNKIFLLKLVDAKSKYQRVGKVMLAARFMFGSYYRYMNSVSVSPVARLNWLGLFEVHGFRDCCRRGKPGQALDERLSLFSVGRKKLLQVSMDGQPLQALSNAPRGGRAEWFSFSGLAKGRRRVGIMFRWLRRRRQR